MRLRVAAPGPPQVGPITRGSGRQQVVRLGPTDINKPRLMVAFRLPGPPSGVYGPRRPVSVAARVRDPVFRGLVLLVQEGVGMVRVEVCHLRLPLFHFLRNKFQVSGGKI